ncbi:MAG: SigE family RNA polymerase sigma factor [Streptomyces sp.]|nr:SigE family RNA polymerase sigma factor [Streptomyces sp.]NUS09878.1 SigE family RNA polymerase sigma factor [Streptomyces sp.]
MGHKSMEAYQEFVAARIGHLHRSAYLLTGGDVHLAEDLVQETLGRIFASWRRVSAADSPAAYAQTVLVRTHLSWRRLRRNRERPVPDGPGTAHDTGTDTAADTDLRLTLMDALKRLPERDRAVIVLRYWEDLSAQETAAALSMSAGAVRAHAMRALARLRDQLGDEHALFANN